MYRYITTDQSFMVVLFFFFFKLKFFWYSIFLCVYIHTLLDGLLYKRRKGTFMIMFPKNKKKKMFIYFKSSFKKVRSFNYKIFWSVKMSTLDFKEINIFIFLMNLFRFVNLLT